MAAIARDKGIDPHDIELWFADEARIGQKNKLTRRWAKRGTRPCAPHDQRTAQPTSSELYARTTAKVQRSSCPVATPRR